MFSANAFDIPGISDLVLKTWCSRLCTRDPSGILSFEQRRSPVLGRMRSICTFYIGGRFRIDRCSLQKIRGRVYNEFVYAFLLLARLLAVNFPYKRRVRDARDLRIVGSGIGDRGGALPGFSPQRVGMKPDELRHTSSFQNKKPLRTRDCQSRQSTSSILRLLVLFQEISVLPFSLKQLISRPLQEVK